MAEATYEIFSETIKRTIENEFRNEVRNEVREKALSEGETKILVRLLTRRFGPLPKRAQTRVNKANTAQLEEWADVVLDASSLTDVLLSPPGRRR